MQLINEDEVLKPIRLAKWVHDACGEANAVAALSNLRRTDSVSDDYRIMDARMACES